MVQADQYMEERFEDPLQVLRKFVPFLNAHHFPSTHNYRSNISYKPFYCVVSRYTFTSHAVFWRTQRASQNTNDK